MLNVGIVGASGYTGGNWPGSWPGTLKFASPWLPRASTRAKPLAEVFPNLRKRVDIVCENLTAEELVERADFFFCAVPHKTAMDIVPSPTGCRQEGGGPERRFLVSTMPRSMRPGTSPTPAPSFWLKRPMVCRSCTAPLLPVPASPPIPVVIRPR